MLFTEDADISNPFARTCQYVLLHSHSFFKLVSSFQTSFLHKIYNAAFMC